MSCDQIQQEILDCFAAGEASLPDRLVAHQNSCVECRKYYQSQALMFQSIAQGLHAIANAPVPPSLLPAVRAHLHGKEVTRASRFQSWTMAVLAATAPAAVAFMLFWHRPMSPGNTPREASRVNAPRTLEPKRDTATVPKAATHAGSRHLLAKQQSVSKLRAFDSQDEPTPEVIVLAEEREAFARFIAQVPKNPEVALALTRPLPEGNESAVEIALLTIKPVEVKPLESSEE